MKPIMDSWITQKGYPVVTLKTDNLQKREGRLTILAEQQRFLRDVGNDETTQEQEDETEKYVNFNYNSPDSGFICVNTNIVDSSIKAGQQHMGTNIFQRVKSPFIIMFSLLRHKSFVFRKGKC